MSTKKIEGYAESMAHHPEAYRFSSCVKTPDANRSTIVVFTGEREPVYTQSEVVAMLREMEEDYHTETSRQQFYAIAAQHGITL